MTPILKTKKPVAPPGLPDSEGPLEHLNSGNLQPFTRVRVTPMLEFAGFHAVLCRTLLTQMLEFACPSRILPGGSVVHRCHTGDLCQVGLRPLDQLPDQVQHDERRRKAEAVFREANNAAVLNELYSSPEVDAARRSSRGEHREDAKGVGDYHEPT